MLCSLRRQPTASVIIEFYCAVIHSTSTGTLAHIRVLLRRCPKPTRAMPLTNATPVRQLAALEAIPREASHVTRRTFVKRLESFETLGPLLIGSD